jgi:hypothetical protein
MGIRFSHVQRVDERPWPRPYLRPWNAGAHAAPRLTRSRSRSRVFEITCPGV